MGKYYLLYLGFICINIIYLKIIQSRKRQKEIKQKQNVDTDNKDIIEKKVLFILQKIMSLTIIHEISGVTVVLMHYLSQFNPCPYNGCYYIIIYFISND